jgi:hypothetical protein
MKKKLILGLVASTLALTLAVGGTLMLFTAQSETATNVVTLGNVAIKMQERKNDSGADSDWTDITKTNTGLTYDAASPGDVLGKQPRVVNTGDIPVYVKVAAEIVFKGDDGTELDWDAKTAIINSAVEYADLGELPAVPSYQPGYNELSDTDKAQIQKNYAFLGLVLPTVDENWFGAPVTVDAEGHFVGTWYYAKRTEGTLGLIDLTNIAGETQANATSPIFKSFTIPLGVANNAQEVEISLNLIAYAVQSKNTTPGTSIETWEELFGDLNTYELPASAEEPAE